VSLLLWLLDVAEFNGILPFLPYQPSHVLVAVVFGDDRGSCSCRCCMNAEDIVNSIEFTMS